MDQILPLFKTHYSLGRSILNLNIEDGQPDEADSVFSIVKENSLTELVLVEDTMTGFLEAYQNCKDFGVKLVFGLRMRICIDALEKNEDSRKTESKVIIFPKNNNGYKKLIKMSTFASRQGFYYYPRIDYKTVKSFWDDKDLKLSIPFYDSYVFNNALYNNLCVPELDFTEPVYFLEDNDLPFDELITEKVKNLTSNTQKTQSIYYKQKKDFKAYLTYKCINNRSSLDKPELDHMTSNEFCAEAWKEKLS
tara:strand:- start:2054 stop:2803 length:750 start_codon:yes stop_codon:yes gene_type:complete